MKTEIQEIRDLKRRVSQLETILHDVIGALKEDSFCERRVPFMVEHYGTLHDEIYRESDDEKETL